MSVTMRHASRSAFGTNVPVFVPLYNQCESWQIASEGETICGRSSLCDLRLDVEGIAERHCRLIFQAGSLSVCRIDGRVWINELPISSLAVLVPGDVLSVGPVSFQIGMALPATAPSFEPPSFQSVLHTTGSTTDNADAAHTYNLSASQTAHTDIPVALIAASTAAPPVMAKSDAISAAITQALLHQEERRSLADLSSATEERIAAAEAKERLLDRREQHIQELNRVLLEREHTVGERVRGLDDRAEFLQNQKTAIAQQAQAAEQTRLANQNQKTELELRQRQLTEQESHFAEKVQASAIAHAQLEQARAELQQRMDVLQARESELDIQGQSLETLALQLEVARSQIESDAAASAALLDAVRLREAVLLEGTSALTARSAAASELKAQDDAAREAAALEIERRLTEADAKWQTTVAFEESLNLRLADLSEKTLCHARERQQLDEQAAMLNQQMLELQAREAEIAQRQVEIEDGRSRATRSVEQLTAIAAEREAAARARDEALSAAQELDAARAALAAERLSLESQAAGLQAWQSRLEAEDVRIAAAQTAVDDVTLHHAQNTAELELERTRLAGERAALEKEVVVLQDARTKFESEQVQLNEQLASRELEQCAVAESRAQLQLQQIEFEGRLESLQRRQEVLAGQQCRLEEWQSELDERHSELSGRTIALKAARSALRASSAEEVNSLMAANEQHVSLEEERQKLTQRQQELEELETRAAELQRAATLALRNAEAEREALHNSHKDLICERNSLVQSSQDLQSRAAGLAEREAIVVQQTEELRSRFYALTQQDSELQKTEAELNSRAADLHRRLLLYKDEMRSGKSESHENPGGSDAMACVATIGDGSQVTELPQALAESEAERALITEERDNLLIAVRELQKAMLHAREDVEEANRIRTEATHHEQALSTLYQALEERSGQLQLLESRLRQAEENRAELNAQIVEMTEVLEGRMHAAKPASDSDLEADQDSQEVSILGQLNALRETVKSGNTAHSGIAYGGQQQPEADHESDNVVHQLRQQIDELRSEIAQAKAVRGPEEPATLSQVDEFHAKIERMEEVLRDRDDLIRELRARLLQHTQQTQRELAESNDRNGIDNREAESRELDRRVELLDEREQELLERHRRVMQSEDEVEAQRRQLLEARQQLEIARAEVQVAIVQHSTTTASQSAIEPPPLMMAGRSGESDSVDFSNDSNIFSATFVNDERQSSYESNSSLDSNSDSGSGSSLGSDDQTESEAAGAAQDLRAELASLFGLKPGATKPGHQETRVPSNEFVDLSEPAGESSTVEFKFGGDAAEIVGINSGDFTGEDSGAARDENSDDFVRDYMEQLLARSRKAAGNTLPSELKPQGQQNAAGPQVPQKTPQKKDAASPPGNRSFIDQYMAGGFPNLDAAQPAEDATASMKPVNPEPLVSRAKVDLQKLRENMDSFRSVSAQSAENALVNHAIRTERLSINGRIMVTFVMVFMTVFLAIANLKGIINHPSLIWGTLIGAVAAGAELVRKYCSVRSRCKAVIAPEGSDQFRKSPAPQAGVNKLLVPDPVGTGPGGPSEVTALHAVSEIPAAVPGTDRPEQEEIGRMESDRNEYFEL